MARFPKIRATTMLFVLGFLLVLWCQHPVEGSPIDIASYYQNPDGTQGYYEREIRREWRPQPYGERKFIKSHRPEAPNIVSGRQIDDMKSSRFAALFF